MKLISRMGSAWPALILLGACSGRDATMVALQLEPAVAAEPPQLEAIILEPGRVAATVFDAGAPGTGGTSGCVSEHQDAGVPPEADAGSPPADAGSEPEPPPPLGACLSCATARCSLQVNHAIGLVSTAENLARVTQLFDCVIGEDWELGGAIPTSSCFFADPAQPLGSLLPCYCGSTPLAQCLATGPGDNSEACGAEVELASQCDPVVASCVTSSGSNPEVALGDALQLLNCERAACPVECGFPPPIEE
jgi:hypothetical protein